MVYSNLEKRRQAAKTRYWKAKGVSLPENNGNNGSAPESLPSPQRIPEFQPPGRQRQLAKAEDWFRNHSSTLTGVVVPLSIGATLGFFGTLFASKYLAELAPKAKSFLSSYLPTSNRQPGPVKSGMDQLLDYAEGVMGRSATY